MSELCVAVAYVLKALFFLVWDTLKACFSPCSGRRSQIDFSRDICLVTGAAQGLGRLFAKELASRHGVLVLLDIQEEKLQQVVDEISLETGASVHPYVCDCSKKEDIYRVAEKVKREVGDVSVLINNAGVVSGKNFMDMADETIERTFNINTLAHFWTAKAFLPWMMQNNYGYIVNIASILAYGGLPRLSDYCASKAAALSFSESLRWELKTAKKTGISITCVCPFHINTQMFTGVTTSCPSLLPMLDADYVVDRTLQAIEARQFVVALPRTMYLLIFMKGFLPTRVMDSLYCLLGAHKALDNMTVR